MSSPKYYWYGAVKKMVNLSTQITKDKSVQATIFSHAIEDAKAETYNLPNGEQRIEAVERILIKQIDTYDSYGRQIGYEARTIQGWCTSFVNLVGKKAGY